jgi:hypothetical protein
MHAMTIVGIKHCVMVGIRHAHDDSGKCRFVP